MGICLEQNADLHTIQLMPLPPIVSCSSKIHNVLPFLVPAHLGSPGQRAVKRMCVCVLSVNEISACLVTDGLQFHSSILSLIFSCLCWSPRPTADCSTATLLSIHPYSCIL